VRADATSLRHVCFKSSRLPIKDRGKRSLHTREESGRFIGGFRRRNGYVRACEQRDRSFGSLRTMGPIAVTIAAALELPR
jgi:hypothetical protein